MTGKRSLKPARPQALGVWATLSNAAGAAGRLLKTTDLGRKRTASVVTVVVLGGLLGSGAAASANVVLDGITVGGVPVAGLQGDGLTSRLMPAARALARRPLKLTVGAKSWVRSPEQLGITVDLPATSAAALKAGRHGPFNWIFHSLGKTRRSVRWVPKVDDARLAAAVDELSRKAKLEASDGDVTFHGSEVKVKPPNEGVALSGAAAVRAIKTAALHPTDQDLIALPSVVTEPAVGAGEVGRIEQQAKAILAAPAQFTFQGRTFSVPPENIAPAFRVRPAEDPETPSAGRTLLLQTDPDALREQIVSAAPFVVREPKNASFTVVGDSVRLDPSEDGATVDTSAAAYQVMGLRDTRKPIDLPAKTTPATFTTEIAKELGVNGVISSFSTSFDPQNAPRVANIFRMASAIDGKVLRPGDSYSLNSATGPRTPERGYQEAQVIVDGELVPGIGGGVCQVATTLFNTVFNAGLDVIERSNHSLFISHYPTGRDATVNYGQQDLRFRNDTKFGILLNAFVTAKGMTVRIFSSPLGRSVEAAVSPQTEPSLPSTKYVDDPTLPAGQEVVQDEGKPGFKISVGRRVTAGGEVLHTDTFVSKYKPWKRIVRRGTGAAPAPAPAPPAAAPPAVPPAAPASVPPVQAPLTPAPAATKKP